MQKTRPGKHFSFDHPFSEFSFSVSVDLDSSTYSYADFVEGRGECVEVYEFRILPSTVEHRLVRKRTVDDENRLMRPEVLDSQILSKEVDENYKMFFSESDMHDLQKELEWHEVKSDILRLCLTHEDKNRWKKELHQFEAKIRKLENSSKQIITYLKETHGIEIAVDAYGAFKPVSGAFNQLSTALKEKKPSEYGLDDWYQFINFTYTKTCYDLASTGGIKVFCESNWYDESLDQAISEGFKVVFSPTPESAYTFLDGLYLSKTLRPSFVTYLKTLTPLSSYKLFENYAKFLSDLDYGLGDSVRAPDPKFPWPMRAMNRDLEHPISQFLSNPEWQSDYLYWVIISTLVQLEFYSFYREAKPYLEKPQGIVSRLINSDKIKKVEAIVRELHELAQIAASRTFSAQELRRRVAESHKLEIQYVPQLLAVLDSYLAKGNPSLVLPNGARTPGEMEGLLFKKVNTA